MASHPYDKDYFHGGAKVGGYAGTGYRDFPVHWTTFAHVMEHKPASVLELGCGRGYLLKRFADYAGIEVTGLEISEHCYLTRAIDGVQVQDVTKAPWPLKDGARDLCISMAFLEHIPEDRLHAVFAEMARVSCRGLHGIDIHDGDGFDQTHCTIRPLAWWRDRLPPGHEAVDKETLEQGRIALPTDIDQGVKLNLGSFTHMFHGWRNLDRIDLSGWARENGYSFTRWNLDDALPYDDRVVDLIFLSHVLEHFDYDTGRRLLADCRRVLKPGGVIRIAVPDAGEIVKLYREGNLGTLREICGGVVDDANPVKTLHELLYSGDHRAIYDWRGLELALREAGFMVAQRMPFHASASDVMRRETIDLYPEMSLFAEASP